jgi:transposase InsO family protein
VTGWATVAHLRTELPLAALRTALRDRRPAPGMLIHHTDSGTQYLSAEYSRWLERAEILPSAADSAYDNVTVESFFRTIDNELVSRRRWTTRFAADLAVFTYINWYNRWRRHTALDMRSPLRYEQQVHTHPTPPLFYQP